MTPDQRDMPDDIWKAAEVAAKMIITAEELEADSYRVYDAAIVVANAILAERQKWAEPKVKPLKWTEMYEDPAEFVPKVIGWEAKCILGRYEISIRDDGDHLIWLQREVIDSTVDEATALSDAKDAAQEHYGQRIRYAILSPANRETE